MAAIHAHADRMEPQRYFFRVSRSVLNQPSTLMAGDVFKLYIRVILNTATPTHLYSTFQTVSCRSFFEGGQFLLQTLLSCVQLFTESVEEIAQEVTSCVQELFQVDEVPPLPSSLESQHREIPLSLEINLYDNGLLAAMEQSTQCRTMVPASNEVIRTSLKKCTVVAGSDECCPICMELLDVNSQCSSMPCHHVFHQSCIVRWLQTNHVCPMCRYSLSTLKN